MFYLENRRSMLEAYADLHAEDDKNGDVHVGDFGLPKTRLQAHRAGVPAGVKNMHNFKHVIIIIINLANKKNIVEHSIKLFKL